MNNTIKLFSAFVLGAAAGLATGLLMAPDKGEKTRKKLIKEVDKAKKDLSVKADEQIEKTQRRIPKNRRGDLKRRQRIDGSG